jgi:hypothetical protein
MRDRFTTFWMVLIPVKVYDYVLTGSFIIHKQLQKSKSFGILSSLFYCVNVCSKIKVVKDYLNDSVSVSVTGKYNWMIRSVSWVSCLQWHA